MTTRNQLRPFLLLTVAVTFAAGATVGCKSGSSPARDAGGTTDLGPTDTATDLAEDGASPSDSSNDDNGPSDGGDAAVSSSYALLVTETPPGPYIDMSLWSGVRRYTVAGKGAPLVMATGIDKSAVHDPESLLFRAASSELFVANRHGDNAADGIPGSISRFLYDRAAGTFTPNGAITGNSLSIVGQMAIHPSTGELFAADFYITGTGPAISRFTIDSNGVPTANGTLGDGPTQGLLIAPDGKRVYLTSGGIRSNVIRQYDLTTGTALATFTVTGAQSLFFMQYFGGEIYVGDLDGNKVFRLTVGATDDLTVKSSFAADGPVSIAFSPDGQELFTSGHLTSNLIDRFTYDAANDTWTRTDQVNTTESLGGVVTVPAP